MAATWRDRSRLCLTFLVLNCGLARCYIFTSNSDLSRMFRVERDMIEVLKEHEAKMEASLASIREYIDQVEEVYRTECSDTSGECRAHGNLGAVHMSLGNNTLALR